jgi:hypothetical protein
MFQSEENSIIISPAVAAEINSQDVSLESESRFFLKNNLSTKPIGKFEHAYEKPGQIDRGRYSSRYFTLL